MYAIRSYYGLDSLAQGDGAEIKTLIVSQGDEIGVMTDGFNRIMARQATLLGEVKNVAGEVGEDAKSLMILGERSRTVSSAISRAQDAVQSAIEQQQNEIEQATDRLTALWNVNREQDQRIREQSASIESGGESITNMTGSIDSVSVITSYSIHYTKLYE